MISLTHMFKNKHIKIIIFVYNLTVIKKQGERMIKHGKSDVF